MFIFPYFVVIKQKRSHYQACRFVRQNSANCFGKLFYGYFWLNGGHGEHIKCITRFMSFL